MSHRRLIAPLCGLLLLSACVAIAGKCELSREPQRWSLSCERGGSAIVIPPSVLSAIVQPASGAQP